MSEPDSSPWVFKTKEKTKAEKQYGTGSLRGQAKWWENIAAMDWKTASKHLAGQTDISWNKERFRWLKENLKKYSGGMAVGAKGGVENFTGFDYEAMKSYLVEGHASELEAKTSVLGEGFRKKKPRSGTILTSPVGLGLAENLGKKTLLGS